MKRILVNCLQTVMMSTAVLLLSLSACKKEDPKLGDAPSQADAAFTFMPSAGNPNIIEFTASNSSLQANWNLGNGASATGPTATGIYPFAGTYTVTLTVQNSGGSASSSQQIVIAQDDPTLISSPVIQLLTGGSSKTWAIDSIAEGHFGVGPNPSSGAGDIPEWYAAKSLEKTGSGMYTDRYTFHLQGFGFDHITQGKIYVNSAHAGEFPYTDTSAVIVGDFTANHPNQMGENWILESGTDTTITVTGTSMIAYWTGVRTYKIVEIDSNKLVLRWLDSKNSDLAWYAVLRPEGYVSAPPPPPSTYTLPLDFENIEPVLTSFGGNSATVISNPNPGGINTSSKVLESIKGNETWGGSFVDLTNKLNFGTNTTIKIKVFAPTTGTFRLKLEERGNTSNFVELDQPVTTANTWVEIVFDLTGTPSDFDRLVFFPSWGVASGGTFYIDDIKQD